jgi:hypothetical protein
MALGRELTTIDDGRYISYCIHFSALQLFIHLSDDKMMVLDTIYP